MQHGDRPDAAAPQSLLLRLFVLAVVVAGAAVLVESGIAIRHVRVDVYLVLLAGLTIASGRLAIRVPGKPVTVSVSEVFVFASVLLYGPAASTLVVAADGVWISLSLRHRRLHRTLFNIAEPAISTWTAAQVFHALARADRFAQPFTSAPSRLAAAAAMAAVFFVLNSGLTAIAVALENRASAYDVWRRHAWYLAINYFAAASLATLAVGNGGTLNLAVVGLAAPLLFLSHVAYREASARVDEAQRHVADVEHLYHAAVEMLAIAVDARDQVTHGHIRRVQRHTLAVAKALGVSGAVDLKAIEAGALLHDIGKLAVPDYVLNKPSSLSRAEHDTMKKHVTMGARILTAVDFPYPVVPIVRHHHEQWDGRGYPDGLVGTEIPIGARILSIVDCFDALTSDRPYRPRMSDERAIEILLSRKGIFYDPAIMEKFIELIPALRCEDAAHDGSDVRGFVVAGLAQAASERGRESTLAAALPTVRPRVRELFGDRVARIADAEACLFAIDAAGDLLMVAHATSRLADSAASIRIPVGGGVSGWVAVNRSTIRNADPRLDLGEAAESLGLRVCISTPIFTRAELFGVLTVYGTRAAGFSDETIASVGMLAQEIGLAIARGDADGDETRLVVRRPSIAAVS